MKMDAILAMSDTDLNDQLAKSGEQIFRVRFQKSMGNLEGLKGLREQKQTIARIKTVQRQRALKTQNVQPAGSTEGVA